MTDTCIFLSPLLKGTMDRLKSMADEHNYGGLNTMLASLQTVAAMIDDAEEKSTVSSARADDDWLQRFQDVFDEVVDLLDNLQIKSTSSSSQLMPKQVSLFPLSRFNPFSQPTLLAQSVQIIARRLNFIAREAKELNIIAPEATFENLISREATDDSRLAFVQDYPKRYYRYEGRCIEFVGRDDDISALTELICHSVKEFDVKEFDGVSVPVIPIVGVMGVGKTALARFLWTPDNSHVNRMFSNIVWVSLTEEYKDDNDKRKIFRQLVGKNNDASDVEEMKMQLQGMLRENYLLVLDDYNNSHKNIVTILKDMKPRKSAILLVTRSHRAASEVGSRPPYRLEPLSLVGSYQLLKSWARNDHGEIPKNLAKLCNGIPLIIREIGESLENEEPSKWEETSKTLQCHGFVGIRGGSGGYNDDLLPRSPYLELPLASFCLQNACGISVDALTCVWMALGCLYSDDSTQQQPEHIARKYVGEIIELGICSDVTYAPGGVVSRIEFNDALLEFVTCSALQQWWFAKRRRSDCALASYKISLKEARYIIWDVDDLPASIFPSPNKVRLFILCITGQASAELVDDIISGFKCLRVLGFGGCNIEMLPDSIGELKHLRYLDVGRNARIKRLPDSICDLWHLQTLFLHGCSQLQELPAEIGRLENLRYLSLTILKESLPEAIGKLISLLTLALIGCPRLASLPTSLKNLKSLQTLGIFGCQELDLTADSSVEGFKELETIHTLLLSNLPKFRGLHSDMGYPSGSMKHLLIRSCPRLTDTSWITQFKPLSSLTIEDCPQLSAVMLKDSTSQLRWLVELVIRRCPSLRDTTWIRQFESLRSLIISGCPKLVELDAGFSALKMLKRLEVKECPGLAKWFASPAAYDWWLEVSIQVMKFDRSRLRRRASHS